jgi:glycosyltransferase involved in cell wall biosynthesis
MRILHAPNHKNIKGTRFFEQAIADLQREGVAVELVMVQGVPNSHLRKLMESCDVIADQLIIGWYAMFAIEAMALRKPVLCFTRSDLEDLYVQANLLERGELPLIKCSPSNVVDVIRELAKAPASSLSEIGNRGRAYVERRHSLDSIGAMFSAIHAELGIHRNA